MVAGERPGTVITQRVVRGPFTDLSLARRVTTPVEGSSSMVVVAVDAGTTMIKAVAFDDGGSELAAARQQTAVHHPRPGFAEQDMIGVWDAVAACIRSCVGQLDRQIDALAVTAQGDGCWLVDESGQPTGPAVLWKDARATAVVDEWRASGVLDRAFRLTGCTGFAGLPHAVLRWFIEHDRERIERSAAALTCGGWLFAEMTGEIVVDESEAAAPWLDVARREYADELLELYDLPWARRLLPELRHDDGRVAPLRAETAAVLGIRPDIPVVLSAYDIVSTAIGVGAVRDGQACSILGTTLCTETVTERPDAEGEPVGLTIPLAHRYLRAMPTLAGCEVLDWAARLLDVPDAAELCRLASTAPAGARGLTFLPYLSPAGERAPFLDPTARGSFSGLGLEHDRALVARAVVEGLTLVIRDCLEASPTWPTELHVCGGGAASAEWCQLIADATGLPTVRSGGEAGARGAYATALVATGQERDYQSAVDRYASPSEAFQPEPARAALYEEMFSAFLASREHAGRDWSRVRDVTSKLGAHVR